MNNNILIIEDEKLNADRLKRLIGMIRPQATILAVLESVQETVDWLSNSPMPDLVMMDVRLSDGLSFEIFEKANITCPIIFTTAYDEYAVKAFKYNSVDYLLKPVEHEELALALEKVEQNHSFSNQQSIEDLVRYLQPKEHRSRFLIPFKDGYKAVSVSDVHYFFLEFKVTKARLQDGAEVALPHTMEELDQQLDPHLFFRANRQCIIHVNAIAQLHNHFNGKIKVALKNSDMEVIVSREKAAALKQWMDC
ncbi:LytTR family DNA-binding domain-containing protein [Pedobacter sp.]|uniref:LytR/AlgR family response regulator transcription factor n=1 Tax=Pedobacter sp. TaxID=1411316 RepID=UPI0031DAEF67